MGLAADLKHRIRLALQRVGVDIRPVRLNDTADYDRLFPDGRFYNVGAGAFFHPRWSNIDYVSEWYRDRQKNVTHHDLMSGDPLPIPDASADIVYTSHTIEHVKDEAVARLFREAFRALKPGGHFRVTTGPDAENDFAAMMRGDEDWFYWDRAYDRPGSYEHMLHAPATSVPLEERWLHHVATMLAPNDLSPSNHKFDAEAIRRIIAERGETGALDYFTSLTEFSPARPGNHVSWWSHDKIAELLKSAGFRTVYRSGYGQSACPVLRNTLYFDNTHPQMSVYMEAVR